MNAAANYNRMMEPRPGNPLQDIMEEEKRLQLTKHEGNHNHQ